MRLWDPPGGGDETGGMSPWQRDPSSGFAGTATTGTAELSIIVRTFNERDNIAPLMSHVADALAVSIGKSCSLTTTQPTIRPPKSDNWRRPTRGYGVFNALGA